MTAGWFWRRLPLAETSDQFLNAAINIIRARYPSSREHDNIIAGSFKKAAEMAGPDLSEAYTWLNDHRSLLYDTKISLHVDLPIQEAEGLLPDETIATGYTAVRERFGEPPADYDKIYCYHKNPKIVKERFLPHIRKGSYNLFILQTDPQLTRYGDKITLAHLFVDLWNMTDWYAKDFTTFLKGKIDELLS